MLSEIKRSVGSLNVVDRIELTWRLVTDGKVDWTAKIPTALAILYFFAPNDLIKDKTGLAGVVDDIAMLAIGTELTKRMADPNIVAGHLKVMAEREQVWQGGRKTSGGGGGSDSRPKPKSEDEKAEDLLSES